MADAARRARLVERHHLAGTAESVEAAVRGVVALHSSDPATPYLGVRARVRGFARRDLERALYGERTLWRMHAMRRTLFVIPADEAPVVLAAASEPVARRERRKVHGWLSAELDGRDVENWMADVEAEVASHLRDVDPLLTREIAAQAPRLDTPITIGSGKWTTRTPLSSRLLFLMAMDGRIVRARPAGSWRSSQYRWADTAHWFGDAPTACPPAEARAALVRRYLARYGPATLADVRWWTGWTARKAKEALDAVDAVRVGLEHAGEGFLLPEDVDREEGKLADRQAPVVSFLPGLDPTPMGWKDRDWYVGPHTARVFDRNGNVGPTVWVDGRIVGGWTQRADGAVVFRLLEDVGSEAVERIDAEAAGLTDWLAGHVVCPRFRTPLERELARTEPSPNL